MEIRQQKYFLRVAETLNFSQAARELFITQSTLSQQILHLEQELSQQLFVRNSHEVILTEAGERPAGPQRLRQDDGAQRTAIQHQGRNQQRRPSLQVCSPDEVCHGTLQVNRQV